MSIDSSITADTEESTEDSPIERPHDHYGLAVYEYDGEEWAVGTLMAAEEAAALAIRESLWAFQASFIAQHVTVKLDDACIRAIEEMQKKLCESCGPIIQAMLGENLNTFIDAAISADGMGHFLNTVDGEEYDGGDIYPGWKDKLAYRV